MILLDASALLAYLRDEPAASRVRDLMKSEPCGVVPVNVAEVVDRLTRRFSADAAAVRGTIETLLGDALVESPVTVRPVFGQVSSALVTTAARRVRCRWLTAF